MGLIVTFFKIKAQNCDEINIFCQYIYYTYVRTGYDSYLQYAQKIFNWTPHVVKP